MLICFSLSLGYISSKYSSGPEVALPELRDSPREVFGRGQLGSALMGTLQILLFLTDFLGTPVNLLVSSQKCQGVPFPQSVKSPYSCSGPISADPLHPQPKVAPYQYIYIFLCVYICIYMYTYVRMYVRMYVRTYVRT